MAKMIKIDGKYIGKPLKKGSGVKHIQQIARSESLYLIAPYTLAIVINGDTIGYTIDIQAFCELADIMT